MDPAGDASSASSSPSAQYSLTLRVEIDHLPGMLGKVASAIGEAGGTIGAVDLVTVEGPHTIRDITVETSDAGDWPRLTDAVNAVPGARVLDATDRTFMLHIGGKIEQHNKSPLKTRDDLSMAYTPGVARVCMAIQEDPDKAFQYTIKRNTVAVVKAIAPGFGGLNLEDISAPRCFEIESRLQAELDIPVFHDDQHGTAVVVLAALLNALTLTGQRIGDIRVVVVGLGAAGVAVSDILMAAGVRHLIGCDSRGAVHTEREDYLDGTMTPVKRSLAERTNAERRSGGPADAIEGADLFIGLSGARVLPVSALARMNPDPIVFAMANPDPEISPEEALPHVRILATGRSDYPNQINNVLCFPGIFRGALDVRARAITEEMKMAAAQAIAAIVPEQERREDYIIPSVFNRDVAPAVAAAVAEQARASGTALAGPEVGFAHGDTMTGSPSGDGHTPRRASS